MKNYIIPILIGASAILVIYGLDEVLPKWAKEIVGVYIIYFSLQWMVKDAVKEALEEAKQD